MRRDEIENAAERRRIKEKSERLPALNKAGRYLVYRHEIQYEIKREPALCEILGAKRRTK